MTFEGKVAVVTGGARGLGREYAERFADDGVAVVITDVLVDELAQAAEEIGTGDRRVLPVVADVTDPAATASIAAAAIDAFGRIDVLVNNAGIWGDFQRTPLLDIDPDYWDFVMAVNVRGPLLCTRAVAPVMIAQGAGRSSTSRRWARTWQRACTACRSWRSTRSRSPSPPSSARPASR